MRFALILFFCSVLYAQFFLPLRIGVLYNRPSVLRSVELGIRFLQLNQVTYNTRFQITTNYTLELANVNDNDVASTVLGATRLANFTDLIGFIGPTFSVQSTAVSAQVSNPFHIPIISFWSTSSALSNKTNHPYFSRVVPPDSLQARAIMDLVYVYEWENVGVIALNEPYGLTGIKDLELNAKLKQIPLFSVTFDPGQSPLDALLQLRNKGVKTIINFIAFAQDQIAVFQEARKLNMTSKGYVWILSESGLETIKINDENNQWNVTESIKDDLIGVMVVRPTSALWNRRKFLFEQWANPALIGAMEMFAFDATLAYGYAIANILNTVPLINVFDIVNENGTFILKYTRNANHTARVVSSFQQTSPIGATGTIKINNLGDRQSTVYELINLKSESKIDISGSWSVQTGLEVYIANITLSGNAVYNEELKLKSSSTGENVWNPVMLPPKDRYGHSLLVHEQGDQLILFGGSDSNLATNDVFLYSFRTSTWSQVYPLSSVPEPRREHAAVLVDGNKQIIFGGYNEKYFLNDVWIFHVQQNVFELIAPNHAVPRDRPSPRFGVAATKNDPIMYIFGGEDLIELKSSIWSYDYRNNTWSELTKNVNPRIPTRSHACLVYFNNRLLVWGGAGETRDLNDFWLFDLNTLTWRSITQIGTIPRPRRKMSCTMYNNLIYLGMGYTDSTDSYFNDLYVADVRSIIAFNLAVWTTVPLVKKHEAKALTQFAVFETYIIWFGGLAKSDTLNSLYSYHVQDRRLELVHPSVYSPDPLSEFSSVTIGSMLYVFGGKSTTTGNDLSVVRNRLWRFDMLEQKWAYTIPKRANSQLPEERFRHASVSYADSFFVFFGESSRSTYFEDIWEYSSSLNQWSIVTYKGIDERVPVPRAGASACSLQQVAYIYGGQNLDTVFDELWMFDLVHYQYIPVPTIGKSPYPFSIDCKSTTLGNQFLIFIGCVDINQQGTPNIFAFDIQNRTWSIVARLPFYLTKSAIAPVSDTEILVHGGGNRKVLTNSFFIVSLDGSIRSLPVAPTSLLPPSRDSHAAHIFGDKLYIFGGYGGAITSKPRKSQAVIYGDVWKFRFSPICTVNNTKDCIRCGPGQYQFKLSCLPCRAGTYSDDFSFDCVPCASGFYSSVIGSDSSDLCAPCEQGTFSSVKGSSSCLPCPSDSFCPIGTSVPFQRLFWASGASDVVSSNYTSLQPVPMEKKDHRNFILNVAAFSSAGGLSLIIIILFLVGWKWFKDYYSRMDMFKTRHYTPGRYGYAIVKKTKFGGFLSLTFYLFALAFILTVVIPFVDDNAQETRSLIPNLVVQISPIKSNIRAQITWMGLSNNFQCTSMPERENNQLLDFIPCNKDVAVRVSGFIQYSNSSLARDTVLCKSSFDPLNPLQKNCTVRIDCVNCAFQQGDKASIEFVATGSQAFARGFAYDITSTSGYIAQNSTVHGWILAAPSTYFRGSGATVLTVGTYQTTYRDYPDNQNRTGFHMDIVNFEVGDTVTAKSFARDNGIAFQLLFLKNSATLEVEKTEKKSTPNMLLQLMGSLAGLSNGFAILLVYCERAFRVIQQYLARMLASSKRASVSEKSIPLLRVASIPLTSEATSVMD